MWPFLCVSCVEAREELVQSIRKMHLQVEKAKAYIERYGLYSFLVWNSFENYVYDCKVNGRIYQLEGLRIKQHEEKMRCLAEETADLEKEMKKLQIEKLRMDMEMAKAKWLPW